VSSSVHGIALSFHSFLYVGFGVHHFPYRPLQKVFAGRGLVTLQIALFFGKARTNSERWYNNMPLAFGRFPPCIPVHRSIRSTLHRFNIKCWNGPVHCSIYSAFHKLRINPAMDRVRNWEPAEMLVASTVRIGTGLAALLLGTAANFWIRTTVFVDCHTVAVNMWHILACGGPRTTAHG
jgi:hypothetical protein